MAMANLLFSSVPFLLFLLSQSVSLGAAATGDPFFSFSFPSFSFPSFDNNNNSELEIGLHGDASITNSTLRVVRSGLVVYRKPIKFVGRNPGFSTYFSFSPSSTNGADFGFFLTLSSVRLDLLDGPPPSIISLSFVSSIDTDTRFTNSTENHLQIDVGGFVPIKIKKEFVLNNTEKLHSWIDYDGTSNQLKVWLGRSRTSKPEMPIASYPIDLSNVLWREAMVVGFTSSSTSADNSSTQIIAKGTQNCTVYEWMFAARHGAPYLMHSEPLDPNKYLARPKPHVLRRIGHPWGIILALIFAAACGAMVTFFAVFVWFSVCTHQPVAPVEYPVHPAEVVYEKIVLVGLKDMHNANSK
ncbi:L-type lectin-domain containing receptor kinase S.4 [Carex littledalei]|uniref:L-type lectin-domain containing receptor kinase S.4 n=1 Tax=Carex littledalei TaxID=544730 RepID=A0A833R4Z8_9POAL|nr:L-type lectin-domain containing receptor kinase S.4 [Carex littledalei]